MAKYRKRTASRRNAQRRINYANNPELRNRDRENSKKWRKNNPRKHKNQRLAMYGITVDDFEKIFKEQNKSCAICGYSDLTNSKFFPVVDHCHDTGIVRGLLCMNCNNGLGKFRDSCRLLQNAIEYLTNTKEIKNG